MIHNLHPIPTGPSDPPTEESPPKLTDSSPDPRKPDATSPARRIPPTRTGTVWFGLCIAALLSVVLIVFMLQNTGSVEITFLGMHGNLPLAMALLIAAVSAAIVTMVVGAARITQLRRLSRHRSD
jgi:uncharacterized integral membrane protein